MLFVVSKENLKKPKISYIFEKKTVLSIIGSKCENVDEKIIKEEDPNEILKLLSLIKNEKYIITLKIWLKIT